MTGAKPEEIVVPAKSRLRQLRVGGQIVVSENPRFPGRSELVAQTLGYSVDTTKGNPKPPNRRSRARVLVPKLGYPRVPKEPLRSHDQSLQGS